MNCASRTPLEEVENKDWLFLYPLIVVGERMYTKEFVANADLLPILKTRNLKIKNEKKVLEFLEKVNYTKIKEYLYHFDPNNKDYKGLDFEVIIDLYYFDKNLRKDILTIIEILEIRLKNDIVKVLAPKDPFSYLDSKTFFGTFKHQEFLREIGNYERKNKDNPLIKTFRQKYPTEKRLPIWIIVEIITLGNISTMYKFMKIGDKIRLVQLFDKNLDKDDFASWIENITLLRNFCAHNGRLWNRNFKPLAKINLSESQRTAGQIKALYIIIKYFKPDYSFKHLRRELTKFFRKYPKFMQNFGISSLDDFKYLKK